MADIGRAATRKGRRQLGRYAIEGTRLHERALRAGLRVDTVLAAHSCLCDESPRVVRLLAELRDGGSLVHSAPDEVVAELIEGRSAGALVGLVPLPEPPELGKLIQKRSRVLLLVGVNVEDPGNAGALTRTALAAGADAFVAIGGTDVFHPRAVRISMGSVFKLPILRCRDVDRLLVELREFRVATVGAVSRGGAPLGSFRLGQPGVALFVGNEAFGLSEGVRAQLDRCVSIPMPDSIDSFSLNAATAILLYAFGSVPPVR